MSRLFEIWQVERTEKGKMLQSGILHIALYIILNLNWTNLSSNIIRHQRFRSNCLGGSVQSQIYKENGESIGTNITSAEAPCPGILF